MNFFEKRLSEQDFESPFDLIIIGGGINGAGTARDAAERGLRVLLLEKNDFASGCTAHSTRLIHGGLRYLEYFEFDLVHESLHERKILLSKYPNLVNPLELIIPIYKSSRVSSFRLNLGLKLYDFLAGKKTLPKHRSLDKNELKKFDFEINETDLQSAAAYYDGQVPFAERLCLENILAAQRAGAICLNHCEVTEIKCKKINNEFIAEGVRFKDLLNHKRPINVYAKHIINMSGPWVDQVNGKFRQELNNLPIHELKRRIGGTKGSHIVVRKFTGAPKEQGIYCEAQSDGRPFFILPYRLGTNDTIYLIGTTDIFVSPEENIDGLKISESEIDYLLRETNHLFPKAALRRNSVIKTYCGVRPLPYTTKGFFEGKVTRKHFICKHNDDKIKNYHSVIGGKLTTFRSLSEELINLFTHAKSSTKSKPTGGCDFPHGLFVPYLRYFTDQFMRKYDINANTAMHLILLYGMHAEDVLLLCREEPKLKKLVHPDFQDIEAQIVYALRHESACTIEDVIMRRLTIGLSRDKGLIDPYIIELIAEHIANEFGLDRHERQAIIDEFLKSK
jgi:glycerol-3-phosphate dehydrogenase